MDKQCRYCGTLKGRLMIQSQTENKIYYSCRACESKIRRVWYRKQGNKEKQLEYNRRYLLKLKLKKNG